jgi:hypothetical protein
MKLACYRAGNLLDARAATPSAADGLRLEEHLAGCTSCRAKANLLDGLRVLHAEPTQGLTREQREQSVLAALDALPPRAAPAPSAERWRWLVLPALAIALLLAWWPRREPTPQARVLPPPAASGDRVLSGQLTRGGSTIDAGGALAAQDHLQSRAGGRLALAHARVELRADTSIGWDRSRHELQLESGSVFVDVDESRHQPFSVRSEHFSVHVLGTRFEVSTAGVRLWRGRVRVTDPQGRELAMLDQAHPSWQPAPPTPQPKAAPVDHPPAPRPDSVLAQARVQLGAGHSVTARRLLDQVLAMPLARAQQAEARSLLAECALIRRQFSTARSVYLEVAKQFSDLPAGKTALFAAGRIEAEHGDPARAARTFERYLALAPDGPFAAEARARLRTRSAASKATAP